MKKLAVVLAAIMMLSTTTFLAVESPVNSDVVVKTEGVDISSTETVEMTATEVKGIFADQATQTTVKAEDVTPVAVFIIDANSVMPADKKVTFAVEGVVAGDKVVALHYYENVWVERSASVVNGEVVVDFGTATHFSPIIIAKVATSAPEEDTTATLPPYNPNLWPWNEIIAREEAAKAAQNAADATLPKTGAVAVLPVAAMVCLAGAVVCGRKEK